MSVIEGPFARRLPYALAVVTLAVGYGIGQANTTTSSGAATPAPAPAVTPAQINEALSGNGLGITATNDRGFSKLENGFQHKHTFPLPLSKAQQAQLGQQMNLSREVAMRYPTMADAVKAGLRRAGPFSPGLGTHMINYLNYGYSAGKGLMTDAQIEHPLAWIYDGTKPTSRVTGLFYQASVTDPGGFAGPNDVWHVHKNICVVFRGGSVEAPLGADRDATPAQCARYHGQLMRATGPLLHVWTVPGYEDAEGVFAHNNPAITCDDGTFHEINLNDIGYHVTTCIDGTE